MENENEVNQGESAKTNNSSSDSKSQADEAKTTTPPQTEKSEANATPKTESNAHDSKDKDSPKVDKSISKIFTTMKEQTKNMDYTRGEISQIRDSIAQLKVHKKGIQKKLKAIGRVSNSIVVLGKKKQKKVGEEDRLLLKAEKEFVKNELIQLNELKWIKLKELKKLVGSDIKTSKKKQTLNKAMSNSYIARNRWSIEGRLLATFNGVIEGNNKVHQDLLLSLQKDSRTVTEENIKEFNEKLADFLEKVDSETFILCSHNLKGPLYTAITLTLQEWSGEGKIESLIFPNEDDQTPESSSN